MIDRNEAIARIRAALKRRSGKPWSVTGDRGTAWGWINIDAPPKRRTWRWVQTNTPEPPAPGAVYAGAAGLTPPYRVVPDALAGGRGEDPILTPADDPWAREAEAAGRAVLYNWEVNDPAYEFGHMAPAERLELTELLGKSQAVHYQGESVSPDAREWAVAAAEALTVADDDAPATLALRR